MDISERARIEELIAKTSYDVRGRILQKMVELEIIFDTYVASHFSGDNNDKFQEFISLMMSGTPLFRKWAIMYYLLSVHNKEFLLKNKEVITNKKLQDIIEIRNLFAHFPIDFSEDALHNYTNTYSIIFRKFKETRENDTPLLFTNYYLSSVNVNEYLNQIYLYIKLFRELVEGVPHPL